MSVARRGCHAERPVQLGIPIDGCLTDDSPLEDVFAVWVERVADLNAAIDAERAERDAAMWEAAERDDPGICARIAARKASRKRGS